MAMPRIDYRLIQQYGTDTVVILYVLRWQASKFASGPGEPRMPPLSDLMMMMILLVTQSMPDQVHRLVGISPKNSNTLTEA